MRIAACTVVAVLAISLEGWAQPPHDHSQREFGLSHRPEPRGRHGLGGSDGGIIGSGSSGFGAGSGSVGASTPAVWSAAPLAAPPFTGVAPVVPAMYLDLPSLPGIPSIRDRTRQFIPDCSRR